MDKNYNPLISDEEMLDSNKMDIFQDYDDYDEENEKFDNWKKSNYADLTLGVL